MIYDFNNQSGELFALHAATSIEVSRVVELGNGDISVGVAHFYPDNEVPNAITFHQLEPALPINAEVPEEATKSPAPVMLYFVDPASILVLAKALITVYDKMTNQPEGNIA